MQSVNAAWTAEEGSKIRNIAQNVLVSWKKQNIVGNRTFTIGVSTIGGNDIIGLNPGAVGGPGIYKYFDESNYVENLNYERAFPIPQGGITKALAEVVLDNTTDRFTPGYMGGDSELFTVANLPRRPIILSGGFNINGINQTLPQFTGILNKAPLISRKDAQIQLSAADYIDFFENRYLDRLAVFTSQRTDAIIRNVLRNQLGMATAQYRLDSGLNTINFAIFESGTKFSDIIGPIVQAENGRFYQDENGIFRFENRQHWDTAPYNQVQLAIYTADVIDSKAPDEDHIINVVEVKSSIRTKLASQLIYQSQAPITLPTSPDTDYMISYEDPILSVDSVKIVANSASDGSGSDVSANIIMIYKVDFSQATKMTFRNGSGATAYITSLQINGRPAKITSQLYYRTKDDSSVTAYEERIFSIENNYIQDISWAQSLALMILNNYSDPQKLQEITIKAKPRLQLGDLISWQGHYWRVYRIKAKLDPSYGYVMELQMLIANITTYFRIGISTIGGGDLIAP